MAKGALKALSLEQPTGVALEALVLQQVAAARGAYAALCKGKDPEALHDLRVALRRMRSLLRAYRRALGLRKRTRHELRDLAAATNPARDAEVRLGIFCTLPAPGAARAKPGVAWAGQRLGAERAARARAARAALDEGCERACRDIERGLQLRDAGRYTPWCVTLAQRLDSAWPALDAEMQALRGEFSMAHLHRLRIEMKRLRYLLEPVVALLTPAKALVAETRALQTLLGDLRDTQLFGQWLLGAAEAAGAARGRADLERSLGLENQPQDQAAQAMPGLAYLAQTVHARESTLEQKVREWLCGESAGRLAGKVERLRAQL